ncbi:Rpn family recombination-promoting nuclease/putative transposase [Thiofilum flexile]|uniref:Rpn family recombination-promoting nuclease/putative transposase n=1 Tax=Thiofilum flexile TaxID=125627 RepID=UPI00037269C9|nr:Rpn family recombination-promoting nuclease/putative transposase [Thiofilum flexile]
MSDVYLNPMTDFGFKKLFGEEPHKDLLISFLNTFLPAHHQVQDLSYTKNEYQGRSAIDRKAIFDLNCISPSGERFIVELQRIKQIFFKDRSIYYATFPIQEQAIRGDWNYKLAAVYTIGILDFLIDDDQTKVYYHAQLKDQDNILFYEKLNFIYLVLPRFKLQAHELKTLQDKWFYVFKHLHELEQIPSQLTDEVFQRLFGIAKIAQLPASERLGYESSLKDYRDFMSTHETSRLDGKKIGLVEGEKIGLEKGEKIGLEKGEKIGLEKGKQLGIEEGKQLGIEEGALQKAQAIALNLLQLGILPETEIARIAGLTLKEVQQLKSV